MFTAIVLGNAGGEWVASVHTDYTVVGCGAKPSEGFGPEVYVLYVIQSESATYEAHRFMIYHNGDDIGTGAGFLCYPGWGLPPVWVVDEGV